MIAASANSPPATAFLHHGRAWPAIHHSSEFVGAPAGLGLHNKVKGLGVPTTPNRGTDYKGKSRAFPNLPNRPEASNPPGRWWQVQPDYPPETDNPLLDAWLASCDPGAWIEALGENAGAAEGEEADDA